MDEQLNNKKDRKKILIVSGLCLILIVAIISYTYSIFVVNKWDTGTITGTVAAGNLSIEVNQVAPYEEKYKEKGLVPQLDKAITSAVKGTKSRCVDDNENVVCQVYEVKVTNEGNTPTKLDGIIELNAGENPNLKWALIDKYSDEMTDKPNLLDKTNSHQIKMFVSGEDFGTSGTVTATKTYYLVIWISEVTGEQNDTGEFNGSITFETATSSALNTLQLLNLTDSIQNDIPDFSKVSYSACDSSTDTTCENTVGIYAAEDDLGTSYYFRGDVTNNYVYFANSYWRIIRINGDGTIRMIYDGVKKRFNGNNITFPNNIDFSSEFNIYGESNAYVGYMYGNPSSNTYYDTHKNENDSTAKRFLEDTWYQTLSENDKKYITDAIYCNDRNLFKEGNFTGAGESTTEYDGHLRILLMDPPAPLLTCANQNDRFTYKTKINNILGNGKLDFPVGLITADEVSMAGAVAGRINQYFYLSYPNYYYNTMTPSHYSDGWYANIVKFSSVNGDDIMAGLGCDMVNIEHLTLPVISLRATALKYDASTSNGSINTPFVVVS